MIFLELSLIGIFVGATSGFFGVGGGMVLVPILLAMGYGIKSAIAISVTQMVFSSIYGSFINYRKGKLEVNDGLWVGFGGILGGLIGSYFTDIFPKEVLEYIFLGLVFFAFLKVLRSKKSLEGVEQKSLSKTVLFFLGIIIGIIAMMLGVGGAVMLIPILVGFLHYPSKDAATAALFFVVFSSLAGFTYKLIAGTFDNLNLELLPVFALAIAAIVGVQLGLKLKELVQDRHHKVMLIVLYFAILLLLIEKIFI
jgi:uncharacterized membrane protein YfcA